MPDALQAATTDNAVNWSWIFFYLLLVKVLYRVAQKTLPTTQIINGSFASFDMYTVRQKK